MMIVVVITSIVRMRLMTLLLLSILGPGSGVCNAAGVHPDQQTRNATLLGLCLQDDPHCTELGPDESCCSRRNEQTERYNTELCVSCGLATWGCSEYDNQEIVVYLLISLCIVLGVHIFMHS